MRTSAKRCLVLGAALAALALTPALAAPAALDPAIGYIMMPDHARDLLQQCSRGTPQDVQGVWVPTAAQIADLETRLPEAVTRAQPDVRGGYGRQYAGYVIAGKKLIYVNAFPRGVLGGDFGKDPSLWYKATHQAVMVCDGGHDFFGVLYDPETKSFSHFRFNGFA